MHSQKTVFITGATGLIGSYLTKILLQNNYKVYALARRQNNIAVTKRIDRILDFWDKDVLSRHRENLIVLEGDITKNRLGLNKKSVDELRWALDEIFHCAAIIKYNWPLEKIRKVNVDGTRNVMDFAYDCQKKGRFNKVNHISTAYVCGDHEGLFREMDLDVGQRFNSTYEQSKYEAELIVWEYRKKGLWIDVFRPAVVIGEDNTGKVPSFDRHFYQIISLISSGTFDRLPIKGYFANVTSVNKLCESMLVISRNNSQRNGTYHLFPSKTHALEHLLDLYKKLLNRENPIAVRSDEIDTVGYTPAQKKIIAGLFLTFNGHVKLNSEMTEKILNKLNFSFSNTKDNIYLKTFEYLADKKIAKKLQP